MTPGNNIVAYGKEVDQALNDFRENELPDDVTITRIADQPKVVSLSVSDFLRDLLISMLIIILIIQQRIIRLRFIIQLWKIKWWLQQ